MATYHPQPPKRTGAISRIEPDSDGLVHKVKRSITVRRVPLVEDIGKGEGIID
ncbi:MAG: hypothetical protein ABID54_09235 [Pseudomonadota bacterium]